MISSMFVSLGWTRDDIKWVWAKWLGLAGLLVMGLGDAQLAPYVSPKILFVLKGVAALSLFFGGQNGNSSLPGKK